MSLVATSLLWDDAVFAAGMPIVRLGLMGDGSWRVSGPGKWPDHRFDRPEQAETFIRANMRVPAMVELQIGGLYIAATLGAGRGRLFGAVRR